MNYIFTAFAALLLASGCDEPPTGRPDPATEIDSGAADYTSGSSLDIDVSSDAKTFVSLAGPSVVSGDGTSWDLAFSGYDVFTNSGPSGPGAGAAFGPLDAAAFLVDGVPSVPFMAQDKTGGAFVGWYYYDGSSHYLWSRYHTFGVKDGERLWKMQLLSYYSERNGGPVAALYNIRYAELTDAGAGPTHSIRLDGTAGGTTPPPDATNGCIDLASGALSQLTSEAAHVSNDWHLCARRDTLSVNGGVSGPRNVTSADLDVAKTAGELLGDVRSLTESSTTAAFEAVTRASFVGATFVPDGIVSAFRDLWVDRSGAPPTRGNGAWLVQGGVSEQKYLVAFPELHGATEATPTRITLSIKKVGTAP